MRTQAALNPLNVFLVICLALWANTGHALGVEQILTGMEATARTYYVSPEGQGDKQGASSANAMAFDQLQELAYEARASTKVKLLPGVYPMTFTLSVRAPSATTVFVLEGEEGTILRGDFDFATEAHTSSGIRLRGGNVIVRGVAFEQTGFCVKSEKNSTVEQVLIENIRARDVHSCVVVDRDSTQPVGDWVVRESAIKGVYRVGVRLAGAQSHDFLLDQLQIDGAHAQGSSDCFKGGIQLLAGVKRVHIRNTAIENIIGSCGDGFQQGDGIEADHRDGTPDQITIENVRIANSGDADLDMKADHVTMKNVQALGGPLTHHAYKMWFYDNYSCTNCVASGSNWALVHLSQAGMRFVDSTFAHTQPVHICDLRHGATTEQRANVLFEGGQVYVGNVEWANECGEGALASMKRLPQGPVPAPASGMNLRLH